MNLLILNEFIHLLMKLLILYRINNEIEKCVEHKYASLVKDFFIWLFKMISCYKNLQM